MEEPHAHRHGRIDRNDHAAAKAGQPDSPGIRRRGRLSVLEEQDSAREPGAAARCRRTRTASDHGEEIAFSFQPPPRRTTGLNVDVTVVHQSQTSHHLSVASGQFASKTLFRRAEKRVSGTIVHSFTSVHNPITSSTGYEY